MNLEKWKQLAAHAPHAAKMLNNIELHYQTEEEQLKAIQKNPSSICFINNPSEHVQLQAVRKNGNVICFIRKPSIKVQIEAILQDHGAIRFIHKPSKTVMTYYLLQVAHDFLQDPEFDLKEPESSK